MKRPAIAGFFAALAVLISRMPEALTHPTLWAEDGAVFFADAFNLGPGASLFGIYRGNLHVAQRGVASLTAGLPLEAIPFCFALVALLVPAVTAALLVSRRFEPAIPDVRVRGFLAFLVVATPSSAELHASLTNVQWHLALLAVLIVLAAPGRSVVAKWGDVAIVAVSSLTGPFGIPLLAVAALDWLGRRERRSLALGAVVGAGALVQAGLLWSTGEVSGGAETRATPQLFLDILVDHVLVGGLLGPRLVSVLHALPGSAVLATLGSFVLVALIAAAALHSGRELRLMLVFSAVLFAMALAAPTTSWSVLARPESAGRYWLMPTLATAAVLVWGAAPSRPRFVRGLCIAGMVLLMLPGVIVGWRHTPRTGVSLAAYAAVLEQAPIGATVEIPIPPEGWSMSLTRR